MFYKFAMNNFLHIMEHTHLRKVLAVILALAGAAVTITDRLGVGTAAQYSFNLVFLLVILPLAAVLWFRENRDMEDKV